MLLRRGLWAGIVSIACCAPAWPSARADGWVEAFTQLRPAPADLNDERLPIAERVALARALGAYGPDADAVPALLSALEAKPPPRLRDEILLALARRAPGEAEPQLAALLARDSNPPPEVGMALAAIGTPEALAALISALSRPEAEEVAQRALLRAGAVAAPQLARALLGPAGLRAASLLGEIGPAARPAAERALLRMLSDGSQALRAAAARALGRLRATAAAPALLARVSDPAPQVAEAALAALWQVAQPAQARALAALLAQPARLPEAQRPLALRALSAADATLATAALARALEGPDAALRTAALLAIEGDRVAPSWLPLLERLFEAELREATASALARVPAGRGVPVLLRAGARSPQAAARAARALSIAVRRFGDELDGEDVEQVHALLVEIEPLERSLVLRALARDPAVLSDVREALHSERASVRAAGAHAAQLLGDSAAAPALVTALMVEHDAEAVRRMSLAALDLGAAVSLRSLQRLLADPDSAPEAMQLAARVADDSALGRELRVELRRVLSSRKPARLRASAALALGAMRDRAAVTPLRAALSDASARVRLAAARALGALGGERAAHACAVHARVERDRAARRAALEAAAKDGEPAELVERGPLVLQARARGAERALFDVLLEDGRWLRVRAYEGGELIVADLPPGTADVRAVYP